LLRLNGLPPPETLNVKLAARPDDVISLAPLAFIVNSVVFKTVAVKLTLVLMNNPVVPIEMKKLPANEKLFPVVPKIMAPLAATSK